MGRWKSRIGTCSKGDPIRIEQWPTGIALCSIHQNQKMVRRVYSYISICTNVQLYIYLYKFTFCMVRWKDRYSAGVSWGTHQACTTPIYVHV